MLSLCLDDNFGCVGKNLLKLGVCVCFFVFQSLKKSRELKCLRFTRPLPHDGGRPFTNGGPSWHQSLADLPFLVVFLHPFFRFFKSWMLFSVLSTTFLCQPFVLLGSPP